MSKPAPVTPLPVAPLLLELRSRRMPDLLHALYEAGFKVSHVAGTNRFRIEDRKENPCR